MKAIYLLLIGVCLGISDAQTVRPRGSRQLSELKPQQELGEFRTANLYSDSNGTVVGAKFVYAPTATPVYVLQIETVPKAFIWVDTPDKSHRGVPHALEHLLAGKGTKGRYITLLTDMRLSRTQAATARDFNFYSFSSGTGMEGFFEQLHAWLDGLFRADFTDAEIEREFYHFGISADETRHLRLVEQGSVYDEDQSEQSTENYYFELNKRLLGPDNPFSWDIRGVPDFMRSVSVKDIRQFYQQHYHIGPTTGFIFIIDPKESITNFLQKVSHEFEAFATTRKVESESGDFEKPKYPVRPSQDTSIETYPFPSRSESNIAAVRFGWKPTRTESQAQLKLLQLFFRGIAGDQDSILYKALIDSKTRELSSGARKTDYDVFLYNSPFFPFEQIEISGIPGDRLSTEIIEQIRRIILSKIQEVSEYPDGSVGLRSFNDLISTYAKAWRRSETIWIKTPPQFGIDLSMDWKQHLEVLQMDRSFVISLSEEPAWHIVEQELRSEKNLWRELIARFHLLDNPAVTASKPSPELFREAENAQQARIRTKIDALRQQYRTSDDQDALDRFKAEDDANTREIDAIQAKVARPRFTDHPPLTPDDDIRYRQFQLAGVAVIASTFDRPPTVDIGLAFDLRKIPRTYYKYLPILPRCFDSVGLKHLEHVVSYPELLAQIQEKALKLSVGYEQNAASGRADLVFRTSAADAKSLTTALSLLGDVLRDSSCDISAVDRIRDLVNQRLVIDESFKNDESRSFQNAAYSFLTQRDTLFQAVNSAFTRSHWDERLKWKLHPSVTAAEIMHLKEFAATLLNQPDISDAEISRQMRRTDLSILEMELVEYWHKNASSFVDGELTKGLHLLTSEVVEDLNAGPLRTIAEIQHLQRLVLDRGALHIDLVADRGELDTITREVSELINILPKPVKETNGSTRQTSQFYPIMTKVAERYHLSEEDFPWRIGLMNPDAINGDMAFYADLPGYSDLDRSSLMKVLSSKVFAENGPHSFFIKTREAGLAYSIWLTSNPAFKLLWDYADRSPDIPAVISLLNRVAQDASHLQDPFIVDYALRATFAIPRSVYPPSTRGIALAQDLRDGNDPEKVRRFSEAILKLRHEPNLFSELAKMAVSSICGILLEPTCSEQHRHSQSIFFFVGSPKTLTDIEKRLAIPTLFRVAPSDYWIE